METSLFKPKRGWVSIPSEGPIVYLDVRIPTGEIAAQCMILLKNGVDSSQKDTFVSIAGEQATEKASYGGEAVISAKPGTIPACATGNRDRMSRNVTHF